MVEAGQHDSLQGRAHPVVRNCPDCGGSGLLADTRDDLTVQEREMLDSTRCHECFGEGRVGPGTASWGPRCF